VQHFNSLLSLPVFGEEKRYEKSIILQIRINETIEIISFQ
jgi:hypothetical protein